ncbi:hypothetical protein [Proteiniphilum sp. UBA1028]|uniref:hypothetical protein n=1 Tax=Proteiniphilum sp. UBA1028 TaxID=1947251 RepID=UPI0025FF5B84|nr:hypothetical protein [Proteiniphilum sp. UBA1028]MDD4630727.1 hypothetical protein [Proteiniphilum sp.]
MKSKRLTSLLAGVLFIGTALFLSSCSDSSDDIVETQWEIQPYTVNASEWSWSVTNRRWEAVKQLKYIDDFIYESGAVIGYVFLGDQNVNEVQVQLPYLKSYELTDGSKFTETISYEYSIQTKRVTFYIEPSDGIEDPDAKVTYHFRIVMIW